MKRYDGYEGPLEGVCCQCAYAGEEETPCPKRDDETHCNHWWDGPEEATNGQ